MDYTFKFGRKKKRLEFIYISGTQAIYKRVLALLVLIYLAPPTLPPFSLYSLFLVGSPEVPLKSIGAVVDLSCNRAIILVHHSHSPITIHS